jgi:hypothetical protein
MFRIARLLQRAKWRLVRAHDARGVSPLRRESLVFFRRTAANGLRSPLRLLVSGNQIALSSAGRHPFEEVLVAKHQASIIDL